MTCGSTTPSLGTSGASGGVASNGQYPAVREPSLTVDDCTLDTDFLDSVARYNDEVDDFDAERFAQRYNELEGDNDRQFRELTTNDEYGESWIRAVDDDSVDAEGIRRTLRIVEDVEDDIEIRDFTSAQTAYENARTDDYLSSWYPDVIGEGEFESPYSENGIVIDATTTQERVLVRAYSSGGESGAAGAFFTGGEDMLHTIRNSDQTISGRYALPGENRDKIAMLELDAETNVRISSVGENDFGPGGGIQYEVRDEDVLENTDQLQTGDFPGEFIVDIPRENLESELGARID